MAEICEYRRLGLVEYAAAWELQNRVADALASGTGLPTLLLLEHPHTYTMGRRAKTENLLLDPAVLTQKGIALHYVDRGGDVTYHGPGQLVGYPILPLARLGWQGERLPQADFMGYLRKLEKTLILALTQFGVAAIQLEGHTGVWVPGAAAAAEDAYHGAGKIASIGVKVDARGITRHGFALNIHPDAAYWQGIVACGLEGVSMVSLADLLDQPPGMAQVEDAVIRAFAQVFGYEMVEKQFQV